MGFQKKLLCKIVFWAGLLATCQGYAQFYNNGAQVQVTNGALLQVKGDFINQDSTFYNAGKVVTDGNFSISPLSTSRFLNAINDTVVVGQNFTDDSRFGQSTGTLVLAGTTQHVRSASGQLANVLVDGGGNKLIDGDIHIRYNLHLKNGYVTVPAASRFGMDSTSSLSPSLITANSFVVGTLYRKLQTGTSDSLFFPVGNSATDYRPATLTTITGSGPQFPVFAVTTFVGTPQAGQEVAKVYNRIWSVAGSSAGYKAGGIRVYYQPSDVALASATELVVAQSAIANGNFQSLGGIPGNGNLKSEQMPSGSYFAIGSSSNLKGAFRVFLEGPFNGAGMQSALNTNLILQDSLLPQANMLPGYSIPANAVDRISFYLMEAAGKNTVDTVHAWLLQDGTIRDYLTGQKPYLTFSKATAGTSYYLIVSHRNHLPASSEALLLTTARPAGYTFDYSKGVYGGGAMYDLSAGIWKLFAADPYKSWKNQTDVMDLTRTGIDNNSALFTRSYRATDLNLDGKVNAQDYQLAGHHNDKLYFSTLP